jgi:hypothetical protein
VQPDWESAHRDPEFVVDNSSLRLYLPSLRTSVRAGDVLDDALAAVIVVEDACWCIAEDDWTSRQPRRWQRRTMKCWHAEHVALCEQRGQIRALARRCGLATV